MIKEIYDIKNLFTLFLFFSEETQLQIISNRFLKIYARTCMNFWIFFWEKSKTKHVIILNWIYNLLSISDTDLFTKINKMKFWDIVKENKLIYVKIFLNVMMDSKKVFLSFNSNYQNKR